MANNKENTLSEILDTIVDADLEDNEEEVHKLLTLFWQYYQSQKRHQYHEITDYILKNMKKVKEGEAIPVIAGNLDRLLEHLRKEWNCTDEISYYDCKKYIPPYDCENVMTVEDGIYNCYDYKQLYRFLLKLYDHIQLEFIRWSEIRKETTRTNSLNRKLRNQLKDVSESQESLQEQYWHVFSEFDDVKEQTKSIYLQMISILGIFAAIVFAVFGGLNVINSISSAFLQGDITVYRTVLVACMTMLFVFWIIIGLLSLAKWTSAEERPGLFAIFLCVGVSVVCLVGIIYALCQSGGAIAPTQ